MLAVEQFVCSVGKGCFQMSLLLELVGLKALIIWVIQPFLSAICFAHIKGDCFRGDAPKEVEFL